jgi:hypothetical protein
MSDGVAPSRPKLRTNSVSAKAELLELANDLLGGHLRPFSSHRHDFGDASLDKNSRIRMAD